MPLLYGAGGAQWGDLLYKYFAPSGAGGHPLFCLLWGDWDRAWNAGRIQDPTELVHDFGDNLPQGSVRGRYLNMPSVSN